MGMSFVDKTTVDLRRIILIKNHLDDLKNMATESKFFLIISSNWIKSDTMTERMRNKRKKIFKKKL